MENVVIPGTNCSLAQPEVIKRIGDDELILTLFSSYQRQVRKRTAQ
jgi:hypothetical protein